MIEERTWPGGFGLLVTSDGDDPLVLPDGRLRHAVLEHGLVVLRGFAFDVDGLQALTDRLFDRRLVYGGARERVNDDDSIQTVDLGRAPLGLHVELGYLPIRPDLAVFHCQVPSSTGGETTVGDGQAILDALRPSTRAMLESSRTRYRNLIRDSAWQRMLQTDDRSVVLALAETLADTTAWFDDEGDLNVDFVANPLIDRPGRRVYADSVHRFDADFADDYQDGIKKTASLLEHGPLDDEVRRELREVCASHAIPLGWQPGDVAILDNWSVLHGRTAFEDDDRRILASFGYAQWLHPEPVANG